jgi:hypothetical protein
MQKTKQENENEEARQKREKILRERAEYRSSLNSAMLDVERELAKIIKENFSTKPGENFALFYKFNDKKVTIAELLYFLGAINVLLHDVQYRVAVHSSFWTGEERAILDTILLENFLKEVPGAVLPPRPERVDAWLNGQEIEGEEPSEKGQSSIEKMLFGE